MFGISIDKRSGRLALQLLEALRRAVHQGTLSSGSELPSSRRFAEELGVSRRLAAEVYDQLVSEGYFVARRGSGTWVAEGLGTTLKPRRPPRSDRPESSPVRFDFSPGIPDLAAFPRRAWLRALDSALSFASMRDLSYGPREGNAVLRSAVAEYLFRHRGISVDPRQVLVTAGTSHSFVLLSLLGLRGTFYFEDPGSGFGSGAFSATGHRLETLPVDEEGARPPSVLPPPGSTLALNPSHQFPTGAVLSASRRLRFLDIAERSDSYLVEDDYDSEFRLKGQPVPAMYSLNPDRVVYLGSFSKSLAPFLRCGYLLAPPALFEKLLDLCRQINARTPAPTTLALARLIASGQLDRHVFRQKRAYQQRQSVIVDWLVSNKYAVTIRGRETGSHLYLEFADRVFDTEFVRRCRSEGLRVVIGAECHQDPERGRNALVLGYGNMALEKLPEGLAILGRQLLRQ